MVRTLYFVIKIIDNKVERSKVFEHFVFLSKSAWILLYLISTYKCNISVDDTLSKFCSTVEGKRFLF